MRLHFTVPGRPQVLHRHRTGKHGSYTTPEVKRAKEMIAAMARQAIRATGFKALSGPVSLRCVFVFAEPKSRTRAQRMAAGSHICTSQRCGDGDNLFKLVSDALNGVAYADDRQVAEAAFSKLWGRECKTIVTVEALVPIMESETAE